MRRYTGEPLSDQEINSIIEAGTWAPSGLNNQPWRFCVIYSRDVRDSLSSLTAYHRIVKECAVCIAVYYNVPSGYNRDKDLMGIGACIQNMLLAAHSLGIGSVWLGEILNKKNEVSAILGIDDDNELAAVIALGRPGETARGKRRPPEEYILKKFG